MPYWYPRLFLHEKHTNELTPPVHWEVHHRYHQLIAKERGEITGKSLLRHALFLTRPNEPPSRKLRALELVEFGDPTAAAGAAGVGYEQRYLMEHGRPINVSTEPSMGLFAGLRFNGVMNGQHGDGGYLLVSNGSADHPGKVLFYDRLAIFSYKCK